MTNPETLIQPITLFLRSADDLYGPITTLHSNGCIVKKIPWITFQLGDNDWKWVRDVRDILQVCCLKGFNLFHLLIFCSRIQTKSSNTSHQNDYQCSGMHFPPSRSYRLPGKQSSTQWRFSTTILQSMTA